MKPVRVVDDLGRRLEWQAPPRRIVSLVPSDTYTLAKLGALDRVIGRTRYCVEPAAEVERIEIVGGTKDVDVDRVVALAPDLVIANQEESSRRDVLRLQDAGLRVLVSFPRRVAAGVAHVARLAIALGIERDENVVAVIASLYRALKEAEAAIAGRRKVPAMVPIWTDPLMTGNGDTFLSDVLEVVGATNVFGDRERRYPLAADLGRAKPSADEKVEGRDTRYPRVTEEEVVERAPELVLLPDEPHAFTEADAAKLRALDIPAAKTGSIVFCDGKDLLWYGARSVEGLGRLRALVDAARGSSHAEN